MFVSGGACSMGPPQHMVFIWHVPGFLAMGPADGILLFLLGWPYLGSVEASLLACREGSKSAERTLRGLLIQAPIILPRALLVWTGSWAL